MASRRVTWPTSPPPSARRASRSSVCPASVPGSAPAADGAAAAPAAIQTKIITVTTDVYKADIDTNGGVIRRLELLKYRDKVDNTKNQLLFHADAANGRLYLAQTGLTPAATGVLPNHNTPFVAKPLVEQAYRAVEAADADLVGHRLRVGAEPRDRPDDRRTDRVGGTAAGDDAADQGALGGEDVRQVVGHLRV